MTGESARRLPHLRPQRAVIRELFQSNSDGLPIAYRRDESVDAGLHRIRDSAHAGGDNWQTARPARLTRELRPPGSSLLLAAAMTRPAGHRRSSPDAQAPGSAGEKRQRI